MSGVVDPNVMKGKKGVRDPSKDMVSSFKAPLEKIELKYGEVSDTVEDINSRVSDLKEELDGLKDGLQWTLNEVHRTLSKRNNALKAMVTELHAQVESLKKELKTPHATDGIR